MFKNAICAHISIMDPSHTEQMKRLSGYRSAAQRRQENQSIRQGSSSPRGMIGTTATTAQGSSSGLVQSVDPLIYPGLYSPSGFDMMSILIRVATRPNPVISIGAVDSSCALVVVDIHGPDMPLVYVSEAFELLTGYTSNEILGRNCRFLQAPDGMVQAGEPRKYGDNNKIYELRSHVYSLQEVQVSIPNFKKGGEPFNNLLTLIPVTWDSTDFRYIVGFQVDLASCVGRS